MNSITLVCVFALFLSLSYGFQMRPSSISMNKNNGATPFNGTYPLGTLIPNRWNHTSITLPSSLSGVPLSSIWIFFSETATGKPIPGISFYRASLSLYTVNQICAYNALTSSLDAARTFPAAYPYTIPAGNLTLNATFSLAASTATNVSISWIFTESTAPQSTISHGSIFVPGWKASGEETGDISMNIPFDAVFAWSAGNVLVGGQSVTMLNNETGAVICSSVASASGDMPPCTTSTSITKGTRVTVVVKSNSTGIANYGGMDFYLAKIIPTTTATTASAATSSSAAASSSHAAASSSAAASGPATASTSHAAASAASSSHATAATTAAAAAAGHAASSGTSGNSGSDNSGSGHSGSGNSGSGNSGSGHSGSGHSGSGSGGNSGSGGHSGSGSGGNSGSSQSSDGSTTQSGSSNSGLSGYSSGGGSSSSGSSGSGFLGGEGSIFTVKKELKQFAQVPKNDVKSAPAAASPRKMTLNDFKRKAMVIADVEDLSEKDKHFRVLEEKSSNKFL